MVVACIVGLLIGGILQVGLGIPIPFGPGLVAAALFCMIMAEPVLGPWLSS
jgi:hypothetical protein